MTPPDQPLLASRGALASTTEVRRGVPGLLAALSRFTNKDARPVAQIHEGPAAPDGTKASCETVRRQFWLFRFR